jgi:uncharacterized tellurite resistance protein B-like protein
MFGSLRTLISSLGEDARLPSQFENQRRRLATAALLIRIATVDGEMSKARLAKLHAVLKSAFDLDDLTATLLIEDAAAADRSAVDLYHFTRQLNAVLDDEGRREIVRMMWQIVLVDGRANEFENNIVWRAADLLAVPSRQRIELRKQVAAEGTDRAGCPPTNR